MKLRLLSVAFALVLAIVLSVGSPACLVPTPTPFPTPVPTSTGTHVESDSAFDVTTARETAQTFLLPDTSEAVALVNSRPVTKGEFLRQVINANAILAFNERFAAANKPGSEGSARQVPVMKSYDVNTRAAAAVLSDAAVLDEAQRRGIQVDEAKVQEFVAQQMSLLKSYPSPELEAMMEILGEDTYWAIQRVAVRDSLLVQGLKSSVTASVSVFPSDRVWPDYRIRLLQSANVVILDKALLAGVDPANCVLYLQDMSKANT